MGAKLQVCNTKMLRRWVVKMFAQWNVVEDLSYTLKNGYTGEFYATYILT